MFDSGISVNSLIQMLKSEVDVAYEVPDGTYIMWINTLEQLLYSEFIHEQNKITVKNPTANTIKITSLSTPANENPVRFEDVYTIYADSVQLIKSTLTSGVIFPNTYYKTGTDIGYNTNDEVAEMIIIYFVRPVMKTEAMSGNVMIPYEFIDLVKAKLRGEAYKLFNEDSVAAKWLNDYNALLESFKNWISLRQSNLGM